MLIASKNLSDAMNEIPAAILCIDDEEPALLLRRRILEKAGYHVLTALTGKEGAFQIFRNSRVAFISSEEFPSTSNPPT